MLWPCFCDSPPCFALCLHCARPAQQAHWPSGLSFPACSGSLQPLLTVGEGLFKTSQIYEKWNFGQKTDGKRFLWNVKPFVLTFLAGNFLTWCFQVVLFFVNTALRFYTESTITVNWPENERRKNVISCGMKRFIWLKCCFHFWWRATGLRFVFGTEQAPAQSCGSAVEPSRATPPQRVPLGAAVPVPAASPVHTWGPWLPAPRECSWHLVDRSTAFSVMLWCASSSVWVTRVRGCPPAPPRPLEALLAPWWTGHFQVENMRIWYLWNKIWVTQTFSYFVFK